jgi:hypothetical protein
MSRARLRDNSSAVSLFPFLAVLICTMGALIVVLLVVTRLERNEARQRALTAARTAPKKEPSVAEDARRELEKANRNLAQLDAIRKRAENQLEHDNLRLRHVEDHMRRLQDELAKLQLAAEELDAMSEKHFDDRTQAEREAARLEQLAADMRGAIDSLRSETGQKKRSYAIVPYVGANGTHRPPIYIECRDDQVILQPEGVELTESDFFPPYGPGNPLAASIRAATEYIAQRQPIGDRGVGIEPYPLLLVRPSGIFRFHNAKKAIQAAGVEFGYQFVDGDWALEYPAADPELANVEYRALELARERQRLLAAAAPTLYNGFEPSRDNDFGEDQFGSEFFGGDGGDLDELVFEEGREATARSQESIDVGHSSLHPSARSAATEAGRAAATVDRARGGNRDAQRAPSGEHATDAQRGGGGSGESHFASVPSVAAVRGKSNSSAERSEDNLAIGEKMHGGQLSTGSPRPGSIASAEATVEAQRSAGTGAVSLPQNNSTSAAISTAETTSASGARSAAQSIDDEPQKSNVSQPRGHDWDFRNKHPTAVPIRRTVRVVIRADRIAILPDAAQPTDSAGDGGEVVLTGATAEGIDQFAKLLRNRMEGWGSAGKGLYWRPVLEIIVGPDGERRAAELARLLKNSGLELRRASTTAHDSGGDSRAAR